MEIPRLGVESEIQLPAYTTATATPDPSLICDLYHSLQQCHVLSPLSGGQGSKPKSSWIIVWFISAEPHWGHPT